MTHVQRQCVGCRPALACHQVRPRPFRDRVRVRDDRGIYARECKPGAKFRIRRETVARAIEYVHAGDCFQVNIAQALSLPLRDPPLEVYGRLRDRNPAPFAGYLDLGDFALASASPERFLRVRDGVVETRPIKGTRPRGLTPEEDFARRQDLRESVKDRAENVMIVDLIRNDMGRIAVAGTVEVPSMFTVEKYPTVLQMTSDVKSQPKPDTTFTDIFAALFPCGSVTGAPKIAAAKAIASLEETPRGVYCGAVGVVRPGGDDFTFNVAIRTAVVDIKTELEPPGRR